jgi:hypothetical protein
LHSSDLSAGFNMSVKLFVAPRFKAGPAMRLLRGEEEQETMLYKKAPKDFSFTYQVVNTINEADFVIVPQSIKNVGERERAYLDGVLRDAHAAGKQVIVFASGDHSYALHIPDVVLFKISAYKSDFPHNEVLHPVYCEDLSEESPLTIRHKSAKPKIGFCGYAGFPTQRARISYMLRNLAIDAKAVLNPLYVTRKRGIYWRRKTMRILSTSSRVQTDFIARDFFSGNPKLMAVSGEEARAQFLDNIQRNDFVLCPRGDANMSTRLYETLSLGRIPVIIDTDKVLPLENQVDYSQFSLRVSYKDIARLGDIVADLYDKLTDEEFVMMQKRAREVFEKYLRYDAYMNYALEMLKEKGIEALR